MGWIAKIMLQGSKQASKQRPSWTFLQEHGRLRCMHAGGGMCTHAGGSGMECRGGARRRGGGRDGCTQWAPHWVNQISLELPRASDPVWVAARQEQCTSIMALPVSNSQPGLQATKMEWSGRWQRVQPLVRSARSANGSLACFLRLV